MSNVLTTSSCLSNSSDEKPVMHRLFCSSFRPSGFLQDFHRSLFIWRQGGTHFVMDFKDAFATIPRSGKPNSCISTSSPPLVMRRVDFGDPPWKTSNSGCMVPRSVRILSNRLTASLSALFLSHISPLFRLPAASTGYMFHCIASILFLTSSLSCTA